MSSPHVVTTTTFKLLDTNNRTFIVVEGDDNGELSIQDYEATPIRYQDFVYLLRELVLVIENRYDARD